MLDSCRALEHEGWNVTYLPVSTGGLLSIDDLAAAIRPDTSLVSVMAVNNEIGVQQPIASVRTSVHAAARCILLHVYRHLSLICRKVYFFFLNVNSMTPVFTLFSHRNNILVVLSSTVWRQRVKLNILLYCSINSLL